MMGLPYGEEIMIVGRTMWTQSISVTDRQTDRQTELRIIGFFLEGGIGSVGIVRDYPLLSHQLSQILYAHSHVQSEQKPKKNFGKSSCEFSQGLPKISRASIYVIH